MSVINSDTKQAWQELANTASKNRPSVGRKVEIVAGRKHKGKIGIVEKHMQDKFFDAFRYATEAQSHMREMSGRSGFVCLIKTDIETFWVKADYTKILEA